MEKVVIVGGTSGMGLASAKLISRKGYRVVVGGRSKDKLDNAIAEAVCIEGAVVDALDSQSLENFFSSIGSFDHLVLCLTGNKGFGMFKDLNVDDMELGFKEKTIAHIRAAQIGLNYINKSGSITFITASSAQSSHLGISGYAAINGAIERMVPPLARELAPLRVNAVSPGVTNTNWWDFVGEMKDSIFSQTKQSLPVNKIGEPEDIASVIMMLIDNNYMTGNIVLVDGGSHLL